jgi:hypothetical protein
VPVAAATFLCEFKLRQQEATKIIASGHGCVCAEMRQSAPKPCNTGMPSQRYCRAGSDLGGKEADVNGKCVLKDN